MSTPATVHPPQQSATPSISLPSALRPARVSVQIARDGDLNNGTGLSSSTAPLSATQSFYGSARRASTAQNAGSNTAVGVGVRVGSSSSNTRTSTGPVPSILPNSAFLSPRKPTAIAARGWQNALPTSTNGLHRPPSSGFDNSLSASSSAMAPTNSQQSNIGSTSTPSMYLHEGGNPTSEDPFKSRSSFSHASHQYSEQQHTLSRNGSLGQHTRAESRQETIASRTSRDPLIRRPVQPGEGSEGGDTVTSARLPRISSSSGSGRPEHGKRKNSKTGSITSLLGFGGRQNQQSEQSNISGEREKRRSMSSNHTSGTINVGRPSMGVPSMPILREVNSEKGHPGETWRNPQDARGNTDGREEGNHYAQAHVSIPVLSDKTHQPLRNYQIYKQQQRLSRSSPSKDPPKRSFLSKILNRRPPNAISHSEQQGTPFGYGTDNLGGNNRFFLSGRLVTSGDSPYPFIGSFCVALFMPAIFLAFEAEWLCSSSSSSSSSTGNSRGVGSFGNSGGIVLLVLFVYITFIMYASMLRTSLRDPGIIPKGLDREPDFESFAVPLGGSEDLTGTGMGQRPRMRMVKFREETVGSKWCETCQTYRPPRTSHCRLCDVCIEQTDHHCSFLNNCIGRRNYPSFIVFLLSSITSALFVIGISIAHLVVRANQTQNGQNFLGSWRTVGTLVVLVVTTAVTVPLMGLMGYHAKLIYLGRTTIEMIRPKYPSDPNGPNKGKPINPYSYSSKFDNIIGTLCRPMDLYSAIEPHEYAEKDGREENPAFR